MKVFFLNKCFPVFLLSIFLLTSCETNETELDQDPVIYFGSGEYWDVTVELSNKDETFLMKFKYKKDINDLRELDRLQFGFGLSLGTFSTSFLDKSLNKGDSPNISFIDFQNINSTTFNITYPNFVNKYSVKDIYNSIKTDGIIIDTSWGNDSKGSRRSEQIRISSSSNLQ